MNLFQLLFICSAVFILFFSRMQGRSLFIRGFFILLFGAAVVLIANPEVSISIAHFFGIGRGVDFFIYIAIGFLLLGYFRIYYHLLKQEEKITLLVRHQAVQEALLAERFGAEK